ncbi:hypothetical protein JNJ66_04015 [Candidatus Saccharibacteria bacterium]|nr:hypothetical protein [Candidatus Saccharibacteria bacterium]
MTLVSEPLPLAGPLETAPPLPLPDVLVRPERPEHAESQEFGTVAEFLLEYKAYVDLLVENGVITQPAAVAMQRVFRTHGVAHSLGLTEMPSDYDTTLSFELPDIEEYHTGFARYENPDFLFIYPPSRRQDYAPLVASYRNGDEVISDVYIIPLQYDPQLGGEELAVGLFASAVKEGEAGLAYDMIRQSLEADSKGTEPLVRPLPVITVVADRGTDTTASLYVRLQGALQ